MSAFEGEKDQKNAEKTAESLSSRSLSPADLLTKLGPALTSSEVAERKSGLEFLTSILDKIPSDLFDGEEIGLMARFYTDRLKNDHHSLNPASISGLCRLITFDHVRDEDLCSGLLTIINGQSVSVQVQVRQDRAVIFAAIETLLNWKLKVLVQNLGSEFVLGYMQSVDGEKDPTNLMYIFRCWPVIIKRFPLEPFTEDIFETLACYFPIDFNPPQGLAKTVSKGDLILGLRNCLSADPSFSTLAIPMFLEKIDSDLDSAKLDASLTFLECLKSYKTDHLSQHLADVWQSYKRQILGIKLRQSAADVDSSSLRVLKEITKVMAKDVQTPENRNCLEKWLEMIWADGGRHLKDIELKLMSLMVDIFSSLTDGTGDFPTTYVLSRAVPSVLETMSKTKDTGKKTMCLTFLTHLFQGSSECLEMTKDSWFSEYVHQCTLSLSSSDLNHFEAGCGAISSGMHLIQKSDLEKIMDHLINITINGEHKIKIPEKFQTLFAALSEKLGRPGEKELDEMFERLKNGHEGLIIPVLDCLRNRDSLVPRVEEVLLDSPSSVEVAVQILTPIVKRSKDLSFLMQPKSMGFKKIVEFSRSGQFKGVFSRFLESVGSKVDPNHLEEIVSVLETFVEEGKAVKKPGDDFEIFKVLLCSMSKTMVRKINIEPIFSKETDLNFIGMGDELGLIRSSVINKCENPERYSDAVMNSGLLDEHQSKQMVWMAKGLMLRPFYKIDKFIEVIVAAIENDNKWVDVKTLVSLEKSHASYYEYNETAFNLARQKVFHLSKDRVVASFNRAPSGSKVRNLLCQLPHVPKSILCSEMSTLIPLFKTCMVSSDQDLLCSSLACIHDVLVSDVDSFADDLIPSLLPLWLDVVSGGSGSGMDVRIKSLECIKASGKMETQKLVHHKKQVFVHLTKAIDDHKRLVRKSAADAKNVWCMAV